MSVVLLIGCLANALRGSSGLAIGLGVALVVVIGIAVARRNAGVDDPRMSPWSTTE